MKQRHYHIVKPTRLYGVNFRSRLEARWAIFFRTLGLDWDYEPQPFDTSLSWYLPDFYIHETGWYVEIKPTAPIEREIIKAKDVSKTNKIAIISGKPDTNVEVRLFENGRQVIRKPSYYKQLSEHWRGNSIEVLINLLHLQVVTNTNNFTKAFEKAGGYKFDR